MTFKIISYLILIGTAKIISCKDAPDCYKFKNGKFVSSSPFTNDQTIIERNDSLQTETEGNTGVTYKGKIVWISPCEYHIYQFYNSNPIQDNIDSFMQTVPVKVKIIKTSDKHYIAKVRVDTSPTFVEYLDTIRVYE